MEISMVLVIIGLITGSIFVGQSLVRQSQILSVGTDVQRYINATLAFQQKYGELPGDFSTATNYWGFAGGSAGTNYTTDCYGTTAIATNPVTCNGNGDGEIAVSGTYVAEGFLFWQHLANAGLIQGGYTGAHGPAGVTDFVPGLNSPLSRVDGATFALVYFGTMQNSTTNYNATYGHVLNFGSYLPNSVPANPALATAEAQAVDSKYDDGLPGTGMILTYTPAFSYTPLCATTSVASTAQYNTSSTTATGKQCNLIFITGF